MPDTSSSFDGYLRGQNSWYDWQSAYVIGGGTTTDNQAAYLSGVIADLDSQSAYTAGASSLITSYTYAYLMGIDRDSLSAYLEGQTMAVDYIIFKTSDSATEKKFRVLSANYDDGTLEKAESRQRTMGGGLDHSVGAVYKSWTMTIRVRHTESESGFGTLADLEYFYSLNKPNGTPTNIITFTDHHSVEYQVRTFGTLPKSLLGTSIEGGEAWFLVQLRLERVTNE